MSGVIGAVIGMAIGFVTGYFLGWNAGFDDALDAIRNMMEGVEDSAMLSFGAVRTLLDMMKGGDADD